jgi:hypothetical protein
VKVSPYGNIKMKTIFCGKELWRIVNGIKVWKSINGNQYHVSCKCRKVAWDKKDSQTLRIFFQVIDCWKIWWTMKLLQPFRKNSHWCTKGKQLRTSTNFKKTSQIQNGGKRKNQFPWVVKDHHKQLKGMNNKKLMIQL